MPLLHFSVRPTPRRPILNTLVVQPERTHHMKPLGLWVTPEGAEYDWSWWCLGERFRLEGLRHALEVRLRGDARVLRLSTEEEVRRFAADYAGDPDAPHLAWLDDLRDAGMAARARRRHAGIEWPRVARDYQGLVIDPYQWGLRLHPDFFWYYGWDCASGCIWDGRAVADLVPRPDVRVVTEEQIRRARNESGRRMTRRKMKKMAARFRVPAALASPVQVSNAT